MYKFFENIFSFVKCLILICCKEFLRNSYDIYFIEYMIYVFSVRVRYINLRFGEESIRFEYEEYV